MGEQTFALVDLKTADEVGRFLDRTVQFIEPKGPGSRAAKWQEVADALMAIANDTDVIRVRSDGPPQQFRRAPRSDDSSVYNASDHLEGHPPGLPWVFATDDQISHFATEAEACTVQRDHRRRNGFDEMTGLPATFGPPPVATGKPRTIAEGELAIWEASEEHHRRQLASCIPRDEGKHQSRVNAARAVVQTIKNYRKLTE